MTYQGRVENGVVVFQNGVAPPLPDGTLVEVVPVQSKVDMCSAIREAMQAEPHLSQEDIAELNRAIAPPHPLSEFVGMFKDDPRIEDWKKSMADYRRKIDQHPELP